MPAPLDSESLADIRDQTNDGPAQNVFLMTEAIAGHRSSPQLWNSFDVLVMVIRHINRHLDQPGRLADTNDDESLKKAFVEQEAANPILRLTWCRFEPTYQSQRDQDVAREAIKAKLWPTSEVPQFMELIRSDVMLSTLFGRDALLLYHPVVLSQSLEREPSESWYPDGRDITNARTAEKSLMHWDCEKESLKECVESHFGMFETAERRYWFRCNKPIIMRVHFTVRPGMFRDNNAHANNHGYDALSRLEIEGGVWKLDPEAGTIKSVEGKTPYMLYMVVRLGDDRYDQRVLFRRYHLGGQMIEEPRNFEHQQRDWKLHDDSGAYVLFYARCSDNSIPRPLGYRFHEVSRPVLDEELRARHHAAYTRFWAGGAD